MDKNEELETLSRTERLNRYQVIYISCNKNGLLMKICELEQEKQNMKNYLLNELKIQDHLKEKDKCVECLFQHPDLGCENCFYKNPNIPRWGIDCCG